MPWKICRPIAVPKECDVYDCCMRCIEDGSKIPVTVTCARSQSWIIWPRHECDLRGIIVWDTENTLMQDSCFNMPCSIKLETAKAVPPLRWLVTVFSLLRPGSCYKGFLVDRITGTGFLWALWFSHASCDFTNCPIFIYHLDNDDT
jgi:hypothetical protein